MEEIKNVAPIESQKADWLRRMEQESWQAELVISGAAIFGSLQLPGLIDEISEYCIGFFAPSSYGILYLFFIYAYLAAYIIIVSFVTHFVLRALWIGMIGLNSVFPKGVAGDKDYYSPHFKKNILKDYPVQDNFIQQLDDFCSGIFASCAYAVLVFMALNIDVLVVFSVLSLLKMFLSSEWVDVITSVFFIVFVSVSIVSGLLNFKKIKNTALAEKIHYPIFHWFTKITLHIFQRPINRLSFTFFSNIELKKYYGWSFAFMIVVFTLFITKAINSKLIFLSTSHLLFSHYDRSDRSLPENYENLRQPGHGRIISAVIEADRIEGKTVRVFVPVPINEDEIMDSRCGAWKEEDGLSREANRQKRREYRLECLHKFHRFYVNDSLHSPQLKAFYHENKGEDGVLTYLPTDHFKTGLNLLRIEKMAKDSVYRSMKIPFWFEK